MSKKIPTMIAVLRIFHDVQEYNYNTWSWLARKTMLLRLKTRFNIEISMSGLKYHLTMLNNFGFIESFPQRRNRKSNGTLYGMSVGRRITLKGLRYLKEIGIKTALFLWNHLTGKKRVPRGKGRNSYQKKTEYASIMPDVPEIVKKFIPPILKTFS